MTTIVPKELPGDESERLLSNPDRGFRMETYLDVATGKSIYEYATWDAIAALKHEYNLYTEEHPTVVQVYFYLTGYSSRPLDELAFQHMQEYFDVLKALGLKALLRFAYIWDDGHPDSQTPSLAQIKQHISQLSSILARNRPTIHALQAGFIGAWGEWAFRQREKTDETAILRQLFTNTPADLKIELRYWNIKSRNFDITDRQTLSRIGFHDDFLIGRPHIWNTAGKNSTSLEYQSLLTDSKTTLVDGEMIWFFANPIYLQCSVIDAESMVERLIQGSFSTLSLAHNYREAENGSFPEISWKNELRRAGVHEKEVPKTGSLQIWKQQLITEDFLNQKNWPYQLTWFKDANDQPIVRNFYEYIRDYLGYRISVDKVTMNSAKAGVEVTLRNTGFAAPIGLQRINLKLIDATGQSIGQADLPTSQLLGNTVVTTVVPNIANRPAVQLAVQLMATNDQSARLANALPFKDGINWISLRNE